MGVVDHVRFLDFGDGTYYDPAEAFKLRFKSNSDGASGSQYESFYDQWASATEAEPMSSFPSVMTGVWNGQVWENYVDNNSGSSSDYKPSDYTATSWYNYISLEHAFVGKIQNEANSAHIGVSFVFFDRTDANDMSSIQQMGTGPCTPCDDGKDSAAGTSAVDAASACTATCPAGKYNDGSGRGCSKCPRGRYAASAGMSECTDCGSGYYSDDTGGTSSSHCLACPVGTYSLSDTYLPSCEHCRDSISCVNCPYGYYGTTTGSSGCTGCPAGKTTTYTGATSASACVDCDQGKYGTNGQPGCTDCGGGTWQGLYGHIGSCTNCPDGKYVAPGAGLTEDSCNSCFIEHTYAPQGSSYSSDCIYCDAGYGTDFGNEQYDCQIVSDGYYRTQFDDFLTPCPVGTTGQWSTSGIVPTGDDMCTVCPEGTASMGEGATFCSSCFDMAMFTEDQEYCYECGPGSEYGDGSSCLLCEPGSYSTGNQEACTLCPGGQLSAIGATGEDECVCHRKATSSRLWQLS